MLKIIVSLSLLLIVTDVLCKPDYIFNYDAKGWFKLHRVPATWEEAFLRCHYEGAVLASPLDKQLLTALTKIMTESNMQRAIFSGTHALYSEKDFFSVEGVPLDDMPIKYFRNKVGVEKGDCLTVSRDTNEYTLYTLSCTEQHSYICYKKYQNETLNECGTFDNKYQYNRQTGSCYKLHDDPQVWSWAYRICAAEGGYLVILNNEEEVNIIRNMFPNPSNHSGGWERMHIGLRAWNLNRVWLTIHGDSMENVYNTWIPGQPDNYGGQQRCGTYIRDRSLDDERCDAKAIFVCEKDPQATRFEKIDAHLFSDVEVHLPDKNGF